jgi:hypothetical protein
MKPFPTSPSLMKRPLPAARTTPRPIPASTMRSTVLQSLLLCPDMESPRHGQGATRSRTR